ncbi:MAG: septal ring lytic transglycosylase RlpA family protein [Pseudomonadota bacterium]|nr:septal ring lytic transglycosylase RlpA family protein [Pseudomonadota bacterium]
MRRAAVAGLLLSMSLLAGCGTSNTRASHGRAAARTVSGQHVSRGDRQPDSFQDDLSKPQSSRYRDNSDSVPTVELDVSELVEPVPKVEPLSLYGNKSPYSVDGTSYAVRPSARGYDERGIASFYGNKFHGYKTSSLETYDMYKFSAASTTLPLPSYARVTNLQNGKSVIVRINDRGPFHDGRLIDLSFAAAVKIGIWPKGTGQVEVVGIDPSHAAPEPARTPVVQDAQSGIFLQIGAFSDAGNAHRLALRLRQAHLGEVQLSDVVVNGQSVHRVRIGPLANVNRADEVSDRIERMGLPRPRVAVD